MAALTRTSFVMNCEHSDDWLMRYADCSECGTYRPVRFVRLSACPACNGWALRWRACSRLCEIELEMKLRLRGERHV
jgi:ribosomal protein L32